MFNNDHQVSGVYMRVSVSAFVKLNALVEIRARTDTTTILIRLWVMIWRYIMFHIIILDDDRAVQNEWGVNAIS